MLVSQWRECIAIKRQWEKGTLKHRLVSYVKNYDKKYFGNYVSLVSTEMMIRRIKCNKKYYKEIQEFCGDRLIDYPDCIYPEHNNRYLEQCYYNLQEKYDRGIISREEYKPIYDLYVGCNHYTEEEIKEKLK